jgi:signal transduction histidine kinase
MPDQPLTDGTRYSAAGASPPTQEAAHERRTDVPAAPDAEQSEREQRLLAEALCETAAILASSLSLADVLDHIVLQAGRVVPYDACAVLLIEGDWARMARSRGFIERGAADRDLPQQWTVSQTTNLRTMLETQAPLVIADVSAYAGWLLTPATAWIRSQVSAPIRAQGRVVGFINLASANPDFFTLAHAKKLQALADQAGLAIENARLFETLRQRSFELDTLALVSSAMRAARTAEDLTPIILEQITRLAGATVGIAFRVEPASEDLVAFDWHPRSLPLTGLRHRKGEGAAGYAAATGELYSSVDIHADLRIHPEPQESVYIGGIRGGISLPLRTSAGKTIGVLQLGLTTPHQFNSDERRLLMAVAEMAANALNRAEAFDMLEQRVAERTVELQRANLQLQELDKLKSQFVSNVSHELRTPLANIKTYLYLLEHGSAEKSAQYLATLHRETDLLHQLIEDLLQLSRLDMGKVRPMLGCLDINEVVEGLAEDRMVLFAMRDLRLATHIAPDPLYARTDRGLLTQVLTNLMTNAMNYTAAGGLVEILTDRRPADGASWATFTVRDTGPGLSEMDRAHLFERFYRGDAARQSQTAGTGLGLAICHDIVERLGGRITVESAPGAGSAFTVWLPLGSN